VKWSTRKPVYYNWAKQKKAEGDEDKRGKINIESI
jgi:hypothetical protein